MIASMILALDEGCDLGFELAGQEVVFEQDAVLERPVPERLWLISVIVRIMRFGSKVDHMLILEGPQGEARKLTALRVLAGDEWSSDELAEIGNMG